MAATTNGLNMADAVMDGNHQLSKRLVKFAMELTDSDATKAKELMHLSLSQITTIADIQRKEKRFGR